MGYRSTIYVKVVKEEQQEFEQMLKDVKLFEYFTLQNENSAYTAKYIGDDLKWYDTYSEVRQVNDWVESGDEHPRGLISIGEDDAVTYLGDTEELDMTTSVSIYW